MQLHTVKTSPLSDASLGQCLAYLVPGAGLLLMQDAVVAATPGHPWQQKLTRLSPTHRLFVLGDDLTARGLAGKVSAPFEVIDYAGFVSLCLEFDAVQSW